MTHGSPQKLKKVLHNSVQQLCRGTIAERCAAAREIEKLALHDRVSARQARPALIVALEDRSPAVRELVRDALFALSGNEASDKMPED